MSQVGGLLGGIAAVLWVLLAIAVAIGLRSAVADRLPFLTKLGVGASGVSMEFAESKLDAAIAATASTDTDRSIGEAAKLGVLTRLERNSALLRDTRILWVDDHPDNNQTIFDLLRPFGVRFDTPKSNLEAIRLLQGASYDVVISDVGRDSEGVNSDTKGLELAKAVFDRFSKQVILFTRHFDPTTLPGRSAEERLQLVKQLRRTSFGYTSYFDELLHLILDVVERQ